MTVEVRKWVTFSGGDPQRGRSRPRAGRCAASPWPRCSRTRTPARYSEDISELIDAGEWLGDELMRRCKAALGDTVEAYGKGGIVGEHGRARARRGGAAPEVRRAGPRASSTASRSSRRSRSAAAMGAHLDIPVHHVKAMLVRIALRRDGDLRPRRADGRRAARGAVAVTNGGRPHARVGGLKAEDAVGTDGLH